MMRLQNRVALITGAGSGIGKATAKLFAQEGAWIGALGHIEAEISAVEEIRAAGGTAMPLQADVSNPDQVDQAVQQLADAWGRIEIVFSNAGINGVWAPIDEIEPEEWEHLRYQPEGCVSDLKYTVPFLRTRRSDPDHQLGPGYAHFHRSRFHRLCLHQGCPGDMAKKMALELARRKSRQCDLSGFHRYRDQRDYDSRSLEKIRLPIEFPKGKCCPPAEKRHLPSRWPNWPCSWLRMTLMDHRYRIWIDGAMSLMQG